jgi:ankyrin repeat protein
VYDPIETKWGEQSLTVGHYAAMFGSTTALERTPLMLTECVDPGGLSQLIVAVEHNHIDFIRRLIEIYDDEYDTGASGWLIESVEEYDEQALNVAIQDHKNDIAILLISAGFPVDHPKQKVSAVQSAAMFNSEILEYILEAHPDVIHTPGLLHLAVEHSNESAIQLLLKNNVNVFELHNDHTAFRGHCKYDIDWNTQIQHIQTLEPGRQEIYHTVSHLLPVPDVSRRIAMMALI